jgi:hypothetical protein
MFEMYWIGGPLWLRICSLGVYTRTGVSLNQLSDGQFLALTPCSQLDTKRPVSNSNSHHVHMCTRRWEMGSLVQPKWRLHGLCCCVQAGAVGLTAGTPHEPTNPRTQFPLPFPCLQTSPVREPSRTPPPSSTTCLSLLQPSTSVYRWAPCLIQGPVQLLT